MAPPLVKILLLVFIRWNKNRSYTEKVKYPLFYDCLFASPDNVSLENGVYFCMTRILSSQALPLFRREVKLKMAVLFPIIYKPYGWSYRASNNLASNGGYIDWTTSSTRGLILLAIVTRSVNISCVLILSEFPMVIPTSRSVRWWHIFKMEMQWGTRPLE